MSLMNTANHKSTYCLVLGTVEKIFRRTPEFRNQKKVIRDRHRCCPCRPNPPANLTLQRRSFSATMSNAVYVSGRGLLYIGTDTRLDVFFRSRPNFRILSVIDSIEYN